MAEAILFNIAQSLFTNLSSTALDEIASTWGFKSRLEKLKNTINTIKDVLLDAEDRQFKSHALRGWLDRLKIALYAADDLFDEFSTMVSIREVMGGSKLSREVINFFSHSNRIALAFNISKKIKKIREELDDIVKDSSEFAFILPIREEGRLTGHLKNQSHSFIDVEEVIGLEDDKEAIIDILMAFSAVQEPRLSIIAIVGMGGMGKKTLAQLIYNDERVNDLFEIKLWVCVSEIFDIKEVIKKILMSATNNESQNLDIDQLLQLLKIAIGGKKYLLVMEDVWFDKHDWYNLRSILKGGGVGSKILITTRSRSVEDIGGNVQAYELGGLSKETSWALFEKMAFEPGESTKKPQLVKLGKEIVKKCAAVPLALRTLGSLLRGEEEWKWISIAGASFAELPDMQNDVLAILKLSYDHLSAPLKNCFAYCALFPMGYKFDKETLVDLWIAEGFVIPANKTQSSKDLGNEYVMQLLQRCFFQNITRDEWGDISGFKMHNFVHYLALQVAGTECKMAKSTDRDFSDRIRHLSFGYHLTGLCDIPNCMLKAKLLRTVLLPAQCKDGSDFNKPNLEQIISNFRCLRVLDLCNLGVKNLPKSIGKLTHLRYLNLSMNPIKELPHSITRLHNLQTLILYHCSRLRKLPIHTRKLANLMSLNVFGCLSLTHMPPGLGELTSLHNLPYFIVKCSSSTRCMPNLVTTTTAQLRDLKTLNNLRGSLEIKLSEYVEDPASEAKEANLSIKPGLTELVIRLGVDSDPNFNPQTSHHDEVLLKGLEPHPNLKKLAIFGYRGQKLPSWTSDNLCMTLPNLVHIRLQHCLSCRQVPSFSQLLYLRCLSLSRLDNVEYMERSLHGLQSSPPLPSNVTFFPSLKELELKGMGNLKGWWEVTQVIDSNIQENLSLLFSDLNILRIIDCPNLATVPLSPNVEEIVLINVNKDLTVLKKLTGSGVSGDVGHSSKLKKLSVDEIENLISLPEECLCYITSLEIMDRNLLNTSRLEEVFKCLSSLRCLKFTNCENLTSIFEGLEHLSSLDSLLLENCKELDLSLDDQRTDSMPWKAIKDLVHYV
ncbi:disease resistance protein RGA2-like [Silene latifolia]|uniref:disease resistance protein RGA2-like n=1 Tax=Silene latifolia TaxID=37657 RepID=UPI003D78B055